MYTQPCLPDIANFKLFSGKIQKKSKGKKIKIIVDQKLEVAKKKLKLIQFDDQLVNVKRTSTRTDQESAEELVDALQKLKDSQEIHMLKHMSKFAAPPPEMGKFSFPPPDVSIPPPLTRQSPPVISKPPVLFQFGPLTPHTFYPRPPFMIKHQNRALVMRKVPRAIIPTQTSASGNAESITDVPLSELMMRSIKKPDKPAFLEPIKVYEVSRGNPCMRSAQSIYLRPPFPSRTYRRAITPSVQGSRSSLIAPAIVPQTYDRRVEKMNISDDSIDDRTDQDKGEISDTATDVSGDINDFY
ncbi:unnamed protein product [Acanthoscelides obtectus]|uniref:Uncharacterized protein n=1 Tax=Acanthoscelides obtectus TaxID=200917 RepID=A0A9P0K5V4_ACAOB|nr:unnamed protein product [Acanthoscelides obtectus]CAK1669707.1 hypothetical protein AOBTE_LOCUS27191 [Acanthoscelides obtectus]